jgi:hypothetical protein
MSQVVEPFLKGKLCVQTPVQPKKVKKKKKDLYLSYEFTKLFYLAH